MPAFLGKINLFLISCFAGNQNGDRKENGWFGVSVMSEGHDADVVVSKINLLNGNLVLLGWNSHFTSIQRDLPPAVGTFEVKSCLNVKKKVHACGIGGRWCHNQEYQSFVLIGYMSGLSSLLEIAHFVIVLKKILTKIWLFGCEVNPTDTLAILEDTEFRWNWKTFLIISSKVVEVLPKNLSLTKKPLLQALNDYFSEP